MVRPKQRRWRLFPGQMSELLLDYARLAFRREEADTAFRVA